ncbi:carboxymuconolactone decarboxylase family protein [Streptomyces winkii]|uniref:carboxymuconolactone decarboxylase family protein n=1 Tax=Streptomyces winkii TaxID=3051178 RepID=UPI0028D549C4|nr:carboxymuconolactone decarboxylase family protein [Streptomyces sp. DSM 40971]
MNASQDPEPRKPLPGATGGPRISPVAPPYDDETQRLLTKWMPPGSELEPLLLFRVLVVHRRLAGRIHPMASGLLNHGTLPARDREVLISRTTARAGAEYEWGVHAVLLGPQAGLDCDVLDALATQPAGSAAFDAHTRLLVTAADELHDRATLSASTWQDLQEAYDDAQLVELLLLAGWYRTLSTVINSTDLPLEPWAARFPA